jgi:archaellum component FlaC
MDVAMIVELISTIGFPIAAVIAMAWFVFKIYKKSEEREDKLMEELQECRVINGKAIETITLYAERLTHIEENITEIKDDVILIKDKMN